ncbi:MAG: class I poly(R)-hydroxyalkanoic acid synthase, partial [Gammaproteobacteria bacterium]
MANEHPAYELPSPLELGETLAQVSTQTQELLQEFLDSHGSAEIGKLDPMGLLPAYAALTRELMREPGKLLEVQLQAWNAYLQVWQRTAQRFFGQGTEDAVAPPASDRRFKAEDWENNPFFDYVKQTYLVTAQTLQALIAGADGLDEKTAKKLAFYTNQYLDAIAPTNFVMTNPQVLHATLESGGRNLVDGLKNFLADIDPRDGRLRTRMVDASAFELGRNVAVTPGKIVYQNALFQLIQYSPSTDEVYRRPLLIIPPWINKYY